MFSKCVLEHVRAERELEIVGVVIDIKKEMSLKKKLQLNIKRGRGGYVFVMAYNKLFDSKEDLFDTRMMMAEWQVPILEMANPYTEENLSKIKAFTADAGVLIKAFGIIKSPLIAVFEKGILSYHHGNMRYYRGQPPAFWELYHDETEMGVTVQRINRGLDRGEVILEKTFHINQRDTLESLERKIYQGSQTMMQTALLRIQQPDFKGVVLEQFGNVYTMPNFRQWMGFKIKMLKRKYRWL